MGKDYKKNGDYKKASKAKTYPVEAEPLEYPKAIQPTVKLERATEKPIDWKPRKG